MPRGGCQHEDRAVRPRRQRVQLDIRSRTSLARCMSRRSRERLVLQQRGAVARARRPPSAALEPSGAKNQVPESARRPTLPRERTAPKDSRRGTMTSAMASWAERSTTFATRMHAPVAVGRSVWPRAAPRCGPAAARLRRERRPLPSALLQAQRSLRGLAQRRRHNPSLARHGTDSALRRGVRLVRGARDRRREAGIELVRH